MTKKRRIYQIGIACCFALCRRQGLLCMVRTVRAPPPKGYTGCRRTPSTPYGKLPGYRPTAGSDNGRTGTAPGRYLGGQHRHRRQHCGREQEKVIGNDLRSRLGRTGSAGRQPEKRNQPKGVGSQPYEGNLAGARDSRRRTNLQP